MSAESDKPVLIVGSMAFDDLALPSGEFRDVVGGAATYSAMAASLFARPRIVAVVGEDFPASVLTDLEARNVDTTGIERAAGKTFRWAGRYAQNLASRETLTTELNVFADFRPKLPPSYRDSSVVLLANIQPELQLEVLDQVHAPKFVAADTMNLWIDIERPALERVIKRVQAMVINDEELRQFAGEHNIKRAAQAILSLGPERLIVKRGEYGAMLFDADGIFFVPAFPLEDEVDPTGAGDTFAGALVGQLAQLGTVDGGTTRRALLTAATVASYCVEGVGMARVRNLTLKDVDRRLNELRSLVHVE
ncbi:MAG TPA: PfkB family carbohydrate kinase [Polyangiaceae bacterium]|nr:PfkB family carbohydrate kinase [Polyangiaceae bacterium]